MDGIEEQIQGMIHHDAALFRWLVDNARFVEIQTHSQLFRCRGAELRAVLDVALLQSKTTNRNGYSDA